LGPQARSDAASCNRFWFSVLWSCGNSLIEEHFRQLVGQWAGMEAQLEVEPHADLKIPWPAPSAASP
jgi:hypothetical protein